MFRNKTTIAIIILISIFIFILIVATKLLYPTIPSEKFWLQLHSQDIRQGNLLVQKLGSTSILSEPQISCSEVFNSQCGIVYIFTTKLSLEEFKRQINNLGYQQILSNTIDPNGLYDLILFETNLHLTLNNAPNEGFNLYNKNQDLNAWGWWLKDTNNRTVDVQFFNIPISSNFTLEDKNLDENIVRIYLSTKGR